MQLKRLFSSFFVACLAGAMLITPALAFPPLPASFYGQVRVNTQLVPAGTAVRALINGTAYATGTTLMYEGGSVYSLIVPGDDTSTPAIEGGKEDDVITFEIGGVRADQTGVWHSGTSNSLDLTASSANPLPTPLPSATPTTQPTVQPTAQPTSQPTMQPSTRPSYTAQPGQPATATSTQPAPSSSPLPAATATSVSMELSPTAPAGSALSTPASLTATASQVQPIQAAPQAYPAGSSQPTGPTQAAESTDQGAPTAAPAASAATTGSTDSILLVGAIVVIVILGGAVWLLPRRKE